MMKKDSRGETVTPWVQPHWGDAMEGGRLVQWQRGFFYWAAFVSWCALFITPVPSCLPHLSIEQSLSVGKGARFSNHKTWHWNDFPKIPWGCFFFFPFCLRLLAVPRNLIAKTWNTSLVQLSPGPDSLDGLSEIIFHREWVSLLLRQKLKIHLVFMGYGKE